MIGIKKYFVQLYSECGVCGVTRWDGNVLYFLKRGEEEKARSYYFEENCSSISVCYCFCVKEGMMWVLICRSCCGTRDLLFIFVPFGLCWIIIVEIK